MYLLRTSNNIANSSPGQDRHGLSARACWHSVEDKISVVNDGKSISHDFLLFYFAKSKREDDQVHTSKQDLNYRTTWGRGGKPSCPRSVQCTPREFTVHHRAGDDHSTLPSEPLSGTHTNTCCSRPRKLITDQC